MQTAHSQITPQTEVQRPMPMRPAPFRILEVAEEVPGCMTLRVTPAGNDGNTEFAPGQFYMMYVFGHGEVPISVSGDPVRSGELVFTVMAVGSVTRAICALKRNDTVGLRGPFGSQWPLEQMRGQDVIIMAGGLGLAPLRPALYQLQLNRDNYRNVALLYGTRQPQSIIFSHQLGEWRERKELDVAVTVDTAGRDWPGHVGIVTELLKGREIDIDNTSALICGPEIMMRFSAYALLDLGVAPERIYLSLERNMQCAIKQCGRCQYGPFFVCADGPVFSFERVEPLFRIREI